MKIAIVGAGWAGLAAAVQATQNGHIATVFEASRVIGGRARALNGTLPDGSPVVLDNGQHILIGAYTDTLALMRQVGINPDDALLRLPLTLQFPDGLGLRFGRWPAPLDALFGVVGARGWGWADKASLLKAGARWRSGGFTCTANLTVADVCQGITPKVMQELIEPLCVSALNTPADRASGPVFLRVMQDSLFGAAGGSNLLLPRVDLTALFPQSAAAWLRAHGAEMRLGRRVEQLQSAASGNGWQVNGEAFDAVILAFSASESARAPVDIASIATNNIANKIQTWMQSAATLQFEAITTVYAWAAHATLPQPVLALRSHANAPAQFVFDRGQLGGPHGLLAFVVSASTGERETLQTQVLAQAAQQMGLRLQAVQTVVEKRATFACTPGLARPAMHIAPGLLACGDYVAGPYPATLEGAVRSGRAAANALGPQ